MSSTRPLAVGDRLRDNDPRVTFERVLRVDAIGSEHVDLIDPRGRRIVVQRRRIHVDERARRTGFSRISAVGRLAPAQQRALEEAMALQGYCDLSWRAGELCGVKGMLATTGLFVGLTHTDYRHRYCFQSAAEAAASFLAWTGEGLPSGQWIIRKGADGELVNPQWAGRAVR